MTGWLIFMLAQAAATAAPAPELIPAPAEADDAVKREIAAIAEQLKIWEGGYYKHEGKPTCRITKSTGDQAVDGIRCGALIGCLTPVSATMQAIWSSDRPEADRQRDVQEIIAGVKPCIDSYQVAAVLKLARARLAEK